MCNTPPARSREISMVVWVSGLDACSTAARTASLALAVCLGWTSGHDRTGNGPSTMRLDTRTMPAAVNRSRAACGFLWITVR